MTINWHVMRSPRLGIILDDPEDFGLRGQYLSYYTSQRMDGEESWDEGSSHEIVRVVKDPNGVYSEERLGIRTWPHWKRYSQKPDPSSFPDSQAFVNYLISHPDYIPIEHFDVDPGTTNYVDAEEVIEWLQSQSEADGYKIMGIKPSDFDIDYDDYSNKGTYTSSSGGGEFSEDGLEWTIDFDSSGWYQVKL